MEKNPFKPTGRRIVIGVLMMVLSLVLFFTCGRVLFDTDSLAILRLLLSVSLVSLGLGGLLFIFLGWWGPAFFFAAGFFVNLPGYLPSPWNIIVVLFYFVGLPGGILLWSHRNKKKKSSEQAKST